jgi:SAM-dependent methyltransferase
MTFRNHFSSRADAYATFRPTYPVELVDFLAELAPRHELAWDAGCGSGQLTVPLATRFARVIGTDPSEEQLARGKRDAGVEYRRARAEASGLPDGVADLAVAAQAAHWFDLRAWYGEIRRVAAQDAGVALVSYGRMRVDSRVDPVIEELYADVLGPFWPPERRHVDDAYRSLPFPFRERKPPRLEIRMEWTLANVLGYIETWSAVRALESAEGAEALEPFRSRLKTVWHPAQELRTVRWPLALRAGRVA